MQKRKTNKFGQKLGLALCMLPLSSWAISSATLDASPLPVVSFHETKDIEATAQSPRKRTITGTITDASDETPIIGANIVLKGKNTAFGARWSSIFYTKTNLFFFFFTFIFQILLLSTVVKI